MKKTARGTIVAVLLMYPFCAEAETQISTDLGFGKYMTAVKYGGKSQRGGASATINIDVLAHNKFLTWGLGYRKNSMVTSIGSLQSDNLSLLLGHYSNFNKSERFGWHLLGGLGAGSFSGMDKDYRSIGYSQNYELSCGLDWMMARQAPFRDQNFHHSDATVISLELKYDSFRQRVRQTDPSGTEQEKFLSMNGFSPTLKLMFFFGK